LEENKRDLEEDQGDNGIEVQQFQEAEQGPVVLEAKSGGDQVHPRAKLQPEQETVGGSEAVRV